MNWDAYIRVSALMFLEFAVWGAWMPVLALRLLGPMKLSGKQTGWVYATLPLACIFAPLASGYLADKYLNAEWVILASHAVGAVLLLVAAKQTKFTGMFLAMLAYSVCYTATLPLVNNVLFRQLPKEDWAYVFLWAPVAWALVGYILTGIRQVRKLGGDGPDSLYMAAFLSLLMVAVCFFQIPTPPKGDAAAVANPMSQALGMLANHSFLVFILAQLVVVGMQQFYFLGTGQFMQDRGIPGKNVSAAMAIAQAVQAVATFFCLGWLIGRVGYQWTFVIGAASWTVLFATYILNKANAGTIAIQAFHGLAYVFFVIGGQYFVGEMAPDTCGFSASAQSVLFIATSGIGLFVGTQLAGFVMQKNCVAGKFQWQKIWAVPLAITLAGAIVFAAAFKAPAPGDFQKDRPEKGKAVAIAAVR
jgi:MFS family permease